MGESKKRLRAWMLDQLESGSCPGVTWVNKEEGIFKIPWYHINNIDSKDVPEKFKIFVNWAKHTRKCGEGDEPDYSKYKTQLRTALTRIADFTELTQDEKSSGTNTEPCRLFKFTTWSMARQKTASPDSTAICDAEHVHYEQSPVQKIHPQGELSKLPIFLQQESNRILDQTKVETSYPYAHDTGSFDFQDPSFNRPDPENQLLPPGLLPVGKNESQFSAPLLPGSLYLTETKLPLPDRQSGFTDPMDCDIVGQAMRVSNIPDTSTNVACSEIPFGILNENNFVTGDSNRGNFEMACGVQDGFDLVKWIAGDSSELPEDLKSISCKDLFPTESSQQMVKQSNSQPASPAQVPVFSDPSNPIGPIIPPLGDTDHQSSAHGMSIVMFYGKSKTNVMQCGVSSKGCRLFYGDKIFENTMLDERMYGPRTAEQLHMPQVEVLGSCEKKVKDYISQSLKAMSRGLILTFKDGDIYADRKCTCAVFVSDSHFVSWPLRRKLEPPGVKVFDYHKFKESCHDNKKPKLAPFFILTFAEDVDPVSPDPLCKVMIHAYVYHNLAKNTVDMDCAGESSLGSLNPRVSDFDSCDKLEENFNKLSTK